jgi:hypothetical protein
LGITFLLLGKFGADEIGEKYFFIDIFDGMLIEASGTGSELSLEILFKAIDSLGCFVLPFGWFLLLFCFILSC